MIQYHTATELAECFARNQRVIREAAEAIEAACAEMKAKFFDTYSFRLHLSSSVNNCHQTIDDILRDMQKAAWRTLIDKLGITRLMSSKRQEEMRKTLDSGRGAGGNDLPEITADNIIAVLKGFVSSADEYLAEAVREEYEFWKPHHERQLNYKTNAKHSEQGLLLGRKVIRG